LLVLQQLYTINLLALQTFRSCPRDDSKKGKASNSPTQIIVEIRLNENFSHFTTCKHKHVGTVILGCEHQFIVDVVVVVVFFLPNTFSSNNFWLFLFIYLFNFTHFANNFFSMFWDVPEFRNIDGPITTPFYQYHQ